MNPDIINKLSDTIYNNIREIWNASTPQHTQRQIISDISQNYNIPPSNIRIASTDEEFAQGILNVDMTFSPPINYITIDSIPGLQTYELSEEKEDTVLFWYGEFAYYKDYDKNVVVSNESEFWVCTKQTHGEFSPKESLTLKFSPWRKAKHKEIIQLLDFHKHCAEKQSVDTTETKLRAIKI